MRALFHEYRIWLAFAVAIGLAAGIGGYTFVYAHGASYLTNDPAACINCHVMREQYDGWIKSSHRAVAVCNDCHTPHDLVGKYATKGQNGFWHSDYGAKPKSHGSGLPPLPRRHRRPDDRRSWPQ